MYILYHPYVKVEIELTDSEFHSTRIQYILGYRDRKYYVFLEEAYKRWTRKYWYVPKESWLVWVLFCIENEYYEYKPDKRYYRLQCAVLVYTDKKRKSDRTPDPFMEARAWTIVSESTRQRLGDNYIFDKLEREACFSMCLMASLYMAFLNKSVSNIEKEYCSPATAKLLVVPYHILIHPIKLVGKAVVAFEVRELDGDEDEIEPDEANCARERICRAIAVYKYDNNTWRDAWEKYDEKWITAVELVLERTDTIRNFEYARIINKTKVVYRGLEAFKEYCRDKVLRAMYYLNMGDRDKAYHFAMELVEDVLDSAWDELKTKELVSVTFEHEDIAKYYFSKDMASVSFERGVEL